MTNSMMPVVKRIGIIVRRRLAAAAGDVRRLGFGAAAWGVR
jgi:hypothetical protein